MLQGAQTVTNYYNYLSLSLQLTVYMAATGNGLLQGAQEVKNKATDPELIREVQVCLISQCVVVCCSVLQCAAV